MKLKERSKNSESVTSGCQVRLHLFGSADGRDELLVLLAPARVQLLLVGRVGRRVLPQLVEERLRFSALGEDIKLENVS